MGTTDEVRAEVHAQMRLLRERAPEVRGSIACSVDGLTIARDPEAAPDARGSGDERTGDEHAADTDLAERSAALSSALLALSRRMITMIGYGGFEETLITGTEGYAACYTAGPSVVLTVLAGPGANLGLLRLEGRKTAEKVAAIASRAPLGAAPPIAHHANPSNGGRTWPESTSLSRR
ncbi:hypothetical protein HNP84_006307 [Thermocatellispora tengchongensis]|uniref:Roadblock/LAMTOR2 domain-containing protein n=1 Tax=Thermocatellispora tengchongensis TaxID=1073253 RepID=A0A840PGE8_9ACTN|nr:roadblock/LC7 domain-containing protein [Thermocatellispora tengchongensis]MBB5136560.1 hypothetical protein [Thermocatellispora tengchongensis]